MPVVKAEDVFPKCVRRSNSSTRCGATLPMLGLLSQGQSGTKANYLECGASQQNPYISTHVSTHGLHRQYISAQSPDSSCGRTLDPDIAISSCLGLDVTMGPSGSVCLSDWHRPSNTSSSMVRGLQHAPK